jgi:hypothetical protein
MKNLSRKNWKEVSFDNFQEVYTPHLINLNEP